MQALYICYILERSNSRENRGILASRVLLPLFEKQPRLCLGPAPLHLPMLLIYRRDLIQHFAPVLLQF